MWAIIYCCILRVWLVIIQGRSVRFIEIDNMGGDEELTFKFMWPNNLSLSTYIYVLHNLLSVPEVAADFLNRVLCSG